MVSYLKWLPLTISTDSRPVVPLYARPRSSSGTPPCCIECVEPVLSLRARLSRSEADEFSCGTAQTNTTFVFIVTQMQKQLISQLIHWHYGMKSSLPQQRVLPLDLILSRLIAICMTTVAVLSYFQVKMEVLSSVKFLLEHFCNLCLLLLYISSITKSSLV